MSERVSESTEAADAADVEQRTLGWVAELLEEPEVRGGDNFLDLGGHSMLALQLSEQAKERFGAEYDIRVLFEGTLAEAAADLTTRTRRA